MTRREYLESIMPTREMVDHFVTPAKADVPVELARIMCNNAQSAFDPEIGWVVCDGLRGGGVDDSRGFYAYEKDGARQVVIARIACVASIRMGIALRIAIRSAMGDMAGVFGRASAGTCSQLRHWRAQCVSGVSANVNCGEGISRQIRNFERVGRRSLSQLGCVAVHSHGTTGAVYAAAFVRQSGKRNRGRAREFV